MLDLALQARLPIISINTDDTINVGAVLSYLVGKNFSEVPIQAVSQMKGNRKYIYLLHAEGLKYEQLYKDAIAHKVTLVLVNCEDEHPLIFNAGVLPLPKQMLENFLSEIAEDEQVPHLMMALGGLSLKDVGEICRICMSEYKALTARYVSEVRRLYMGRLRGIQQVDTTYKFYAPSKALEQWLEVDGKLFDKNLPPEMQPRGLLFDGDPGTGKTMGAKFIANELGVPLFRLDMGSLLGKYVGESEGNLNTALTQVDQTEPCVLLIDEVEKLFQGKEDSGVTTRLLSSLLWWLQEHRSKVFSILTTNDKSKLPDELYRPGRIDSVVTFRGLQGASAREFVREVYGPYKHYMFSHTKGSAGVFQFVLNAVDKLYDPNGVDRYSQAELTQLVFTVIKRNMVDHLTNSTG